MNHELEAGQPSQPQVSNAGTALPLLRARVETSLNFEAEQDQVNEDEILQPFMEPIVKGSREYENESATARSSASGETESIWFMHAVDSSV